MPKHPKAAVVSLTVRLLVTTAVLFAGHAATRAAGEDAGTSVPECCRPKIARAPRAGVLLFRSEQCPASQKVAKMADQAADDLTSSPVLFVTLDFSTPRQAEQSEFLTKQLGLEKVWSGFARQTGYILIVDLATGKPRAKVTEFDSAELLVRHVREMF